MSSEDDICFTGTDGLTCHQFIRAIREHALEAEKQQDNRWIADYASIRFDGEALKWFESLDDETQADWKLLRRALLAHYSEPTYYDTIQEQTANDPVFIFSGKDKDECRAFVKDIRLRAYREGKEGDSNWMVKLAFPCFASKALDWYVALPQDVRQDWSRLERALILDYPTPLNVAISPARIRIDDWYKTAAPAQSLRALRSREDWLAQARERRKIYLETGNNSLPCWLLVETEKEIPENAVTTGYDNSGKPLYSARLWHQSYQLQVGKCGRHLPGAHVPLFQKDIPQLRPFEVLVGDQSLFQWIAVPDKPKDHMSIIHRRFEGVDAGFDSGRGHRATLICQIYHEGAWLPGKAHSGDARTYAGIDGKEVACNTVRVLGWVET